MRGWGLRLYAATLALLLVAPVAVTVAFAFNDTAGRFNLRWQGFTWRHWGDAFALGDLAGALRASGLLALAAATAAVSLGTPLGIALARGRFRGRGALETLVYLPVATPEIVMGAALLGWFITLGLPRGPLTLFVSHVAFTIPFVAATVRARAARLPAGIEDAARDLGAAPLTVLRTVTLPLLAPAIAAAGALAVIVSLDDFVVTAFTAGRTLTFPLWVYGASRFGVPPQVNVIATVTFAAGVAVAIGAVAAGRRRPESAVVPGRRRARA